MFENIEPKAVLNYFAELAKIPHGSGNCKAISDYIYNFCKNLGLETTQDEALNVVAVCPASAGRENDEPIILQGHMDMVAVCEEGFGIDMKNHSLDLFVEGDWLGAKHTSLGGDDGIAVAMIMAILADRNLSHPKLYAVITTEEEVGMDGARALDMSNIDAKLLINIDSEEEGYFTCGCAGGARFKAAQKCKAVPAKDGLTFINIEVSGLTGGHSGVEIDKGRANACVLLASVLELLKQDFEYELAGMCGGVADNVIAMSASAVIGVPSDRKEEIVDFINGWGKVTKAECEKTDPNMSVVVSDSTEKPSLVCNKEDAEAIVNFMSGMPNGVIAMSEHLKGLVETSLNFGILDAKVEGNEYVFLADWSIRSNIEDKKQMLIKECSDIASMNGIGFNLVGEYPGWEFVTDSVLQKKMISVYKKLYGETPEICTIHAGLECGLFATKIKGLDAVSIGPDMRAIHSVGERLSLSSTKRVFEFVCEVLKN